MAKKTSKRPARGKGFKLYSAYLFRDKDPAIDEFRTVAQDHFGKRNLAHVDYDEIHEQGGPTGSCVKSWFEGKTKRPQNATLEAAGRALGMKRVWIKQDAKSNVVPLKKKA
jgi:hypothetical protein